MQRQGMCRSLLSVFHAGLVATLKRIKLLLQKTRDMFIGWDMNSMYQKGF